MRPRVGLESRPIFGQRQCHCPTGTAALDALPADVAVAAAAVDAADAGVTLSDVTDALGIAYDGLNILDRAMGAMAAGGVNDGGQCAEGCPPGREQREVRQSDPAPPVVGRLLSGRLAHRRQSPTVRPIRRPS